MILATFAEILAHADGDPTPELASNILWPSMRVIGLQVKHLTGVSEELAVQTARLIRVIDAAQSIELDDRGRDALGRAKALVAQWEGA